MVRILDCLLAASEPDDKPPLEMSPKELGRFGEKIAFHFFEARGYYVLERNYTTIVGEADIIALDKDELVFIEVKTRIGEEQMEAEEAVTTAKQTTYEKLAIIYTTNFDEYETIRFDVVAITVQNNNEGLLRHIKNAYYFDE